MHNRLPDVFQNNFIVFIFICINNACNTYLGIVVCLVSCCSNIWKDFSFHQIKTKFAGTLAVKPKFSKISSSKADLPAKPLQAWQP